MLAVTTGANPSGFLWCWCNNTAIASGATAYIEPLLAQPVTRNGGDLVPERIRLTLLWLKRLEVALVLRWERFGRDLFDLVLIFSFVWMSVLLLESV